VLGIKASSRSPLFHLLNLFPYVLDLGSVLADVETQVRVDEVGDPDQGEAADKVAAPVTMLANGASALLHH
jgi:hypothetical protein